MIATHTRDFDNVAIDDDIHEDLPMTIENPNTKRTLLFTLSFLFFLFAIFLFYSFLPNSKYTQNITINAGEARKIDIDNAYRGKFEIKLYSIKSQINLNTHKLYFGQFRINLSIKYFLDDNDKKEKILNDVLIEPIFDLNQKISFPITIYEDELPKNIDSLSLIFISERISINKIVLEFVFDNSMHCSIDLTWKIFGSIALFALLFQYYRIIFSKDNKKICRLEQKLILIYLIILMFESYPLCFLFNFCPYLENVQQSISNSFYLCLILILFKSIRMRGKKFSIIPFMVIFFIFTIIDLIDTKFSYHHGDAFIGIIYLILYCFEFISAISKRDETEQFKLKIYSFIFVFIPLFLLLSRILTKWCELFYLKHINSISTKFAHFIFAFLLSYLFSPFDPIDEVEYIQIQK